jgi:hypothetical protein
MAIFKLDQKRRIWQEFLNDTWKFEQFFLGHSLSYILLRGAQYIAPGAKCIYF